MRRDQIMSILQAATDAVDPGMSVRAAVRRDGDALSIAGRAYDLASYGHVYVVGTGKATGAMAAAIEELLGDHLSGGVVTVKRGTAAATRTIRQLEAGHPVPDAAGVAGARQVLEMADAATAGDLVICLISGGGSALLVAPAEPVTLEEKQRLTQLMLRAGCTINEMNAVRKHLSDVKGGQLARRAAPAEIVTLAVSDVLGNPLDVIASGPTVPDPTTFDDALAVLARHELLDQAPRSIRERLEAGRRGEIEDTPKPGDPAFARVFNAIIASNDVACDAALDKAAQLGFHTMLLSTYVEGEAREVAKVLAAVGRQIERDGRPAPTPACVVAGGETTVTVRRDGLGGRNQELALSAARQIRGSGRIVIAAYATDGDDGPTDASGGIVDGGTVDRAIAAGVDLDEALRRNDAYHALLASGDLLRTGPTGTNVNDLLLVLVF